MNGCVCHICGTMKTKYVHEIYDQDRPWLMMNVLYCEKCAKMCDEIESAMGRCVIAHKSEVKE